MEKSSLTSLGVGCIIKSLDLAKSGSRCEVAGPNRVDLYLNSFLLQEKAQYSIIITGITNPNIAITATSATNTDNMFAITSYFDHNVYAQHIICLSYAAMPKINVSPIRQCSISVSASIKDASQSNVDYSFKF